MRTQLSPPSHLHARQSNKHSPIKHNFLTLCTDRPCGAQQQKQGQSNWPTLAHSPTDRNKTKIRLVSPLKHANRSNLATKQNSSQHNAQPTTAKQASPFKPILQIQLGGTKRKPQQNLNELSNISIKQHLQIGEKQPDTCTRKTLISNKYAQFVIMSPSHQAMPQVKPSASPFRKQQPCHLTLNSKPFDISSLKSQIIHVSPFHHVSPSPQVRFQHVNRQPTIHEESESSSLKQCCEEDLREVREMKKEMEEESTRIKQALKSSRISQQVCVSQLVYAEEERTQKRNPSKIINFEDVPLHQSREGTQLKVQLSPPESCSKIETSLIQHQIKCHPHPQCFQECRTIIIAQVGKQAEVEQKCEQPRVQHQHHQLAAPRTSLNQPWTNSQKTLINQLNFVTAKRLSEDKKIDQVCVQTEVIEECEQTGGQKSNRFKLAIFRNQQCNISLRTSREENKNNEEELNSKQDIQVITPNEAQQEETQITQPFQHRQCQQQQGQKCDPQQVAESKQQEKKEQQDSCNIYQQEQNIAVPSVEVIAQLHQSQLQYEQPLNQSSLSLQLEPVLTDSKKQEVQIPKQVQKLSPKIVDTAKQVELLSKKQMASILSMKSLKSSTSGKDKDGGISKMVSSKRLINNSIYL